MTARETSRRPAGLRADGQAIPLYEQTLADRERVLDASRPATKAVREKLAALTG